MSPRRTISRHAGSGLEPQGLAWRQPTGRNQPQDARVRGRQSAERAGPPCALPRLVGNTAPPRPGPRATIGPSAGSARQRRQRHAARLGRRQPNISPAVPAAPAVVEAPRHPPAVPLGPVCAPATSPPASGRSGPSSSSSPPAGAQSSRGLGARSSAAVGGVPGARDCGHWRHPPITGWDPPIDHQPHRCYPGRLDRTADGTRLPGFRTKCRDPCRPPPVKASRRRTPPSTSAAPQRRAYHVNR